MSSRPVTITQVYVQETEPTDTRDGILWVDTTVNPPKTKVYDADTGSWEPVATKNVHIQDTAPDAPGDGEIWVDTSLTRPRAKVYDAGAAQWNKQIDATEFGNHKGDASAHHAKPTATQSASKSRGYFTVNSSGSPSSKQVDEVADEVICYDGGTTSCQIRVNMADGTQYTADLAGGGDSVTLTFTAGTVDSIGFDYTDNYADVHQIGLAPHSHNI